MKGETNTQMKNRHKKYQESISIKGVKYPDLVLDGEKYFIDCPFCTKRIYGKSRDIDQYYKNHLENYHNVIKVKNKEILGKNFS
jgi:hypothetical protein